MNQHDDITFVRQINQNKIVDTHHHKFKCLLLFNKDTIGREQHNKSQSITIKNNDKTSVFIIKSNKHKKTKINKTQKNKN